MTEDTSSNDAPDETRRGTLEEPPAEQTPSDKPANEAMAAEWNGPSGAHRAKYSALINNEITRQNERFRAIAEVGRHDYVLDIGCGTGESTREAARAAVDGHVTGVDLSEEMLGMARGMSLAEGLDNVTFLQADAQTHEFEEASFDLALSRYGSMFFDDPLAAFTNVANALRPGGRLVLLVWQARARNEWSVAVRNALGGAPADPVEGPGPFSLADPAAVADILEAAGFAEFTAIDVHEPVNYGPDGEVAYDLVIGMRSTREILADLTDDELPRAHERLRRMLIAHETPEGVLFDSRSWIITAVRQEQECDVELEFD